MNGKTFAQIVVMIQLFACEPTARPLLSIKPKPRDAAPAAATAQPTAQPTQTASPAATPTGSASPGTTDLQRLGGECLHAGDQFVIPATGTISGNVYGTGIYTCDSMIGAAAVHAGVLRDGETGSVRVTILAGLEKYDASAKNGVTSLTWDYWANSMRIDGLASSPAPASPTTDFEKMGGDCTKVGAQFVVEATGTTTGIVYGTDTFTCDSIIGAAALHAGALTDGEKAKVRVTVLSGLDHYDPSTSNGVASMSWGTYSASIKIERH